MAAGMEEDPSMGDGLLRVAISEAVGGLAGVGGLAAGALVLVVAVGPDALACWPTGVLAAEDVAPGGWLLWPGRARRVPMTTATTVAVATMSTERAPGRLPGIFLVPGGRPGG